MVDQQDAERKIDNVPRHQQLFREEVIKQRLSQSLGEVFINLPANLVFITVIILCLMMCLCFFAIHFHIHEKYEVKGYLNHDHGLVSLFPVKNGIIKTNYIQQGKPVKKNDVLLIIDTSYQSESVQHDNDVLRNWQVQKATLAEQINIKEDLYRKKLKLYKEHYLSKEEIDKTNDDLLALKRSYQSISLEVIKSSRDDHYAIRSPIDGIVSSVDVHMGQEVTTDLPVIQIAPIHSKLIAQLYVPVSKSGFIHVGQDVVLQYHAYPYTHFGSYRATIIEIDQSSLTDEQDVKPFKCNEPYYRVKASIDQQNILLYKKQHPLQQGMTFDAIIIGPKKSIIAWFFDPLFSFYGNTIL